MKKHNTYTKNETLYLRLLHMYKYDILYKTKEEKLKEESFDEWVKRNNYRTAY